MFQVIKRNGEYEEFNPQKIKNSIIKAFKAVEQKYGCILSAQNYDLIDKFISDLGKTDSILPIEIIQDRVEQFLCTNWFQVGRVFMLYREQHKHNSSLKFE